LIARRHASHCSDAITPIFSFSLADDAAIIAFQITPPATLTLRLSLTLITPYSFIDEGPPGWPDATPLPPSATLMPLRHWPRRHDIEASLRHYAGWLTCQRHAATQLIIAEEAITFASH
jgi:hypothetical protein